MNKSIIAFTMLLGFILFAGCKNNELQSYKPENKVVIDGQDSDWDNIPLHYEEDMQASLGLMNNDENMYITIRFNDQNLAKRIQMMGLTVWLNNEGNKDKKYGLVYTGSLELSQNMPSLRPGEPTNDMSEKNPMPGFRNKDLPEPGTITIINNEEKRSGPEGNLEGPAAASAIQKGIYCYEFKIPYNVRELNQENENNSPEKINVCLELGGLSKEDKEKMKTEISGRGGMSGSMDRGGRGGGMGGGRSGGMGGGRGGRMGGSRDGGERPSLDKKEIWFNVKLAIQESESAHF